MAEGPDDRNPLEDEEDEEDLKAKETEEKNMNTSDWLSSLLKRNVGLEDTPVREKVIPSLDLAGIAVHIKSGKVKNIITMAGAGISTSAGIPDFRSPGSGLYDNLQEYNLPSPQAIFEIGFFKEHPEPFFMLAKNLWPGLFKPTPCHLFLRLLHEKNLLLRHYSQNIDTLEHVAGVPSEKLVEAHGSFHTAHCITCHTEYTQSWIKEEIFADKIPKCTSGECDGLVKPDIVFFGEKLPSRFFDCANQDLSKCDLLIIMGTSLVVQPFASLTNRVPEGCPRLYLNLENSTVQVDPLMALFGFGQDFRFDKEDNYRDVFEKGTCDDSCQKLADLLGWGDELRDLISKEHSAIEKSADHKPETKEIQGAKSTTSSEASENESKSPVKKEEAKNPKSTTPSQQSPSVSPSTKSAKACPASMSTKGAKTSPPSNNKAE